MGKGFTDYLDEAWNGIKDAGNGVYDKFYGKPAAKKTAALNDLDVRLQSLGEGAKTYSMEGMNRALDAYAPVDAAYYSLYGDPGSLSTATKHAPPPKRVVASPPPAQATLYGPAAAPPPGAPPASATGAPPPSNQPPPPPPPGGAGNSNMRGNRRGKPDDAYQTDMIYGRQVFAPWLDYGGG